VSILSLHATQLSNKKQFWGRLAKRIDKKGAVFITTPFYCKNNEF
jgi:hypothetical protein